jgi:hypothetical protein
MILAICFLGAWVALTGLWIAGLVDAGRTDNVAFTRVHANKGATLVLLVLAGWFGAIYWFAVLRPRIQRIAAAPPMPVRR